MAKPCLYKLNSEDTSEQTYREGTSMYAVETADGRVIALQRDYSKAVAIQTQLDQEGIKTTVRKCYR